MRTKCESASKTGNNGKDRMHKRIELVVTDEWFDMVGSAARALGLGRSAFIRVAVIEKIRREEEPRHAP